MRKKIQKPKFSNLEIVNEMYKNAFAVKKLAISQAHPEITPDELQKLTLKYFYELDSKK